MNRIGPWNTTSGTPGGGRRARREGAGEPRKRPIGPLALPMPSETARVESLDDGSLRISDTLSREGLGRFLVQTGDLVREGLLETPAWFGVSLRDGASVRFDRGQGPDAPSRLADAMCHMGRRVLDRVVDPASVAFALDCGCGVKVDRRAGGDRDAAPDPAGSDPVAPDVKAPDAPQVTSP